MPGWRSRLLTLKRCITRIVLEGPVRGLAIISPPSPRIDLTAESRASYVKRRKGGVPPEHPVDPSERTERTQPAAAALRWCCRSSYSPRAAYSAGSRRGGARARGCGGGRGGVLPWTCVEVAAGRRHLADTRQ